MLSVIRPGTLFIREGTTLPSSVVLTGTLEHENWNSVEGGAELLSLKTVLTEAHWSYFYMDAVHQTVLGGGPKGLASAMGRLVARVLAKGCNSLQVDQVSSRSWLGIPYLDVSAHYCHIQEGIRFGQ